MSERPQPQPALLTLGKVVAFAAMVGGMFLAILDIQIVAASLAEVQAGLNATDDEIARVQTSYLIAEVIMIPLSGILSRAYGIRRVFIISIASFTLFSVACATSRDINDMVIWRTLQGFTGGAMIPLVFSTAYLAFTRQQQSLVLPIIGMVSTLAPTLGPTLSGFITETCGWRGIFFVNVPAGILIGVAIWFMATKDRGEPGLLRRLDWLSFFSMAAFLGSLQYVLDEGARLDWFEDPSIVAVSVVAGLGGVTFITRACLADLPVVSLRPFANYSFSFGCIFSFGLGIGLYGLAFLYPLYLVRIRGYTAITVGETVIVTGACMFAAAPFARKLVGLLDPRLMLGLGLVGLAASTWQLTFVTSDWGFDELIIPQCFRGVSMIMAMVPVTDLALGSLPPPAVKNASGLFNLMRNLGGAVGLAAIHTTLNLRFDLHYANLRDHLSFGQAPIEELVAARSLGSDAIRYENNEQALRQLAQLTHTESLVMAFSDVFLLLTVFFATLALFVFILQKKAA